MQPRVTTPRPVWNPDQQQTHDFRADWQEMPETETYRNGFRSQWEMFIRHVVEGRAVPVLAARGRQGPAARRGGARPALRERRWVDVPDLRR